MKIFTFDRSLQDILKRTAIEVWPALAVLFLTVVISGLFSGFTFAVGMESLWKILLRFLRFSFILLIPVPLLPRVCGLMQGLLNRRSLFGPDPGGAPSCPHTLANLAHPALAGHRPGHAHRNQAHRPGTDLLKFGD